MPPPTGEPQWLQNSRAFVQIVVGVGALRGLEWLFTRWRQVRAEKKIEQADVATHWREIAHESKESEATNRAIIRDYLLGQIEKQNKDMAAMRKMMEAQHGQLIEARENNARLASRLELLHGQVQGVVESVTLMPGVSPPPMAPRPKPDKSND